MRRSVVHGSVPDGRRGPGVRAAGIRLSFSSVLKHRRPGAAPARLVFNADAGVVLAAAIGRSRTQLGVCNLAGEVLTMADVDQRSVSAPMN